MENTRMLAIEPYQRDVQVIARGLDGARTTVAEVMSAPLVAVSPRDSVDRVIDFMVEHGIRRVPVLCGGRPTGIVALDDLAVASSGGLSDIARGIQRGSPVGGHPATAAQARLQLESRLERLDAEIERFGGAARDSLLQRLETIRQHLRSDAP
jgi:signal-transduction protein with cAMP-binding, CBS, and nucleotidyltransferase domain